MGEAAGEGLGEQSLQDGSEGGAREPRNHVEESGNKRREAEFQGASGSNFASSPHGPF